MDWLAATLNFIQLDLNLTQRARTQTAIDQGIIPQNEPRLIARVFLGMFAISGFSQTTITDPGSTVMELKEMAEGISEIFLNGVLEKE